MPVECDTNDGAQAWLVTTWLTYAWFFLGFSLWVGPYSLRGFSTYPRHGIDEPPNMAGRTPSQKRAARRRLRIKEGLFVFFYGLLVFVPAGVGGFLIWTRGNWSTGANCAVLGVQTFTFVLHIIWFFFHYQWKRLGPGLWAGGVHLVSAAVTGILATVLKLVDDGTGANAWGTSLLWWYFLGTLVFYAIQNGYLHKGRSIYDSTADKLDETVDRFGRPVRNRYRKSRPSRVRSSAKSTAQPRKTDWIDEMDAMNHRN
jgi:hypothetical protein